MNSRKRVKKKIYQADTNSTFTRDEVGHSTYPIPRFFDPFEILWAIGTQRIEVAYIQDGVLTSTK